MEMNYNRQNNKNGKHEMKCLICHLNLLLLKTHLQTIYNWLG